jgi:hypothetical protein
MLANEPTDNTWHQQPMIWMIIGLLGITMIASFAMLYVASTNAPDLVVADYSNINEISAQTRARDKRAVALGLSAVVLLEPANTAVPTMKIQVQLKAGEAALWPDRIIVKTVNSTLAALDTQTELTGRNGNFSGTLDLPRNTYNLHIEDPERTWRLSKRVTGQPQQLELSAYKPGS